MIGTAEAGAQDMMNGAVNAASGGQIAAVALLVALSCVAAVATLLVLRLTSNPLALTARKRQIQASVFELLLFNDDWRQLLRAQSQIIRHNLAYIWGWALPLAVLAVPLGWLVTQLAGRLEYRGLPVGQAAFVTVTVDPGGDGQAIGLTTPPEIHVDDVNPWFPSIGEKIFVITPRAATTAAIVVHAGGNPLTKTIDVSDGLSPRSAERVRTGWLGALLNPGEAPLPPGTSVRSIAVSYPRRDFNLGGGWRLGWAPCFFGLTAAFTFALKRPLRVVW